ncbi:MAG: hypothetical protein HRT86_07880 [Ilumatobacteraceae bacterium]|nr:hypothetical protein [Ilumatobacteraceae bacterium]
MAFVNKQGADAQTEQAGQSGQIDFDPNDPTVVKVHYDLAAWSWEQRAELSEALAEELIPHAWDGEELLVPEVVEADADALFERIESEIGPFPVALEADAEVTEFGLDEWTDADREVLTEALVETEVPHRWEGTTVLVAGDAEDAVDELLDAIEAGELVSADQDGPGAPDDALSAMFLSADRLAKNPNDADARVALIELSPLLDPKVPPYGMAQRPWAQAVGGVDAIVEVVRDEGDGAAGLDGSSDVIGRAQELRSLVRPYV